MPLSWACFFFHFQIYIEAVNENPQVMPPFVQNTNACSLTCSSNQATIVPLYEASLPSDMILIIIIIAVVLDDNLGI